MKSIILLKTSLSCLLLIVFSSVSSALCPCIQTDKWLDSADIKNSSIHLDEIKACDEYRKNIGIVINPGISPIFSRLREYKVTKMDSSTLELLIYLQEKHTKFQEKIGYSANLCADPLLKNEKEMQDDKFEKLNKILQKGCEEYNDDMDSSLAVRSIVWNNWEKDITTNALIADEPHNGRMKIITGSILLPLGTAAFIANAFFIRYVYTDGSGYYDPYASLIMLAMTTLSSGASVAMPIVLIKSGINNKNEQQQFYEEKDYLIKRGYSFNISLNLPLNKIVKLFK
jgi:hypothetical protein